MNNLKQRLINLEKSTPDKEGLASNVVFSTSSGESPITSQSESLDWKKSLEASQSKNPTQNADVLNIYLGMLDKVLSELFYDQRNIKFYYSINASQTSTYLALKNLVQYFQLTLTQKSNEPRYIEVQEIMITINESYTRMDICCLDSISDTSRWIQQMNMLNKDNKSIVKLQNINRSLLGELNTIQLSFSHDLLKNARNNQQQGITRNDLNK